MCCRGIPRAPGDRRCPPSRGAGPPHPRARTRDSIPPSQAASALPSHEARRDTDTVRGDRRRAVGARVGHADEHLSKFEEQSFLHAELAIATRRMPSRRRGLPVKAVLKFPQKFPRSPGAGDPAAALRSLVQ